MPSKQDKTTTTGWKEDWAVMHILSGIPFIMRLVWLSWAISKWVKDRSIFNKGLHSTTMSFKPGYGRLLHCTRRCLSSRAWAEASVMTLRSTEIRWCANVIFFFDKKKGLSKCEAVRFTFWKINLSFGGVGSSHCIDGTQIHFLFGFPRKLESAVSLRGGAHSPCCTCCFMHRDDIWHISSVGTKLFWPLGKSEKKDEWVRYFHFGNFSLEKKQCKMHCFVTGAEQQMWPLYLPE